MEGFADRRQFPGQRPTGGPAPHLSEHEIADNFSLLEERGRCLGQPRMTAVDGQFSLGAAPTEGAFVAGTAEAKKFGILPHGTAKGDPSLGVRKDLLLRIVKENHADSGEDEKILHKVAKIFGIDLKWHFHSFFRNVFTSF